MRKSIFAFLVVLLLCFCSDNSGQLAALQDQVNELQKKLDDTYKPGFGEFMSNIQVHHAKLWFAGQNQNWKLAEFESHEITETLEALSKYQAGREETQSLPMLKPALDNMTTAIEQKDPVSFKNGFVSLTRTCNDCHRATQFEFNIVKIPDTPPFSNQAFRTEPLNSVNLPK